MPRRSQENYFDDFWLDLVKNDARDHGGDTGDQSIDKKRSQYFVNDIMVKYVRCLKSLVFQKC